MRSIDDCPTLEPELSRGVALIEQAKRIARRECADELREMAEDFPHAVRIAFRIAAERLVGK